MPTIAVVKDVPTARPRLSSRGRPWYRVKASSSTYFNFGKDTFFGPDLSGDQVTLYDQICYDKKSVRFWSPFVDAKIVANEHSQLPVMFFLPGFDGTGLSASRQYRSLMRSFDLMVFSIPIDEDGSFAELVDEIVEYITLYLNHTQNDRPVYLLGESFGGLIAIAIAAKLPDLIDRLILLNPATSYKQSIWPILGPLIPQLPNELYGVLPFVLSPLLGNPILLAASDVDLTKPIPQQINAAIKGISTVIGTLGFIGDVYTPERVSIRLKTVQEGFEIVQSLIPKIPQRTLLLTSEGDWMLPSGDERERLSGLMQRCRSRSLGPRSHAVLMESGVSLSKIIKEEGFYVTKRQFSGKNGKPVKLNAFGQPFPVELPTETERENTLLIDQFKQLSSPVFYSTTANNRIVRGLGAFPDERPLLIVGNHQLMGIDSGLLVEGVLREKQVLMRGLAHPIAFSNFGREEGTSKENVRQNSAMGDLFATYGVVRVSPKNLHKLLEQRECVLLYPGGVREGFRLRDETYQIFWPDRAEFVRMAAKFQATIVTVASIGLEETFEVVLDRQELVQLPILGDLIKERFKSIPPARFWSNTSDVMMIPPLLRPRIPRRQYFLFGKPFQTTIDHYNDSDKEQQLYEEIKVDLERNIAYLLRESKRDPYGDFFRRLIHERSNNGEQAPSFNP